MSHVHDLHVTSRVLEQETLITSTVIVILCLVHLLSGEIAFRKMENSSEEEQHVMIHFLIVEGDHDNWHFKTHYRMRMKIMFHRK